MFGDDLVEAMRRFRGIWDPSGLMNPGKVVDARPPTSDLRLGAHWSPADPQDLFFRYPDDDGSFQRAVLRCVGVGKCHSPQKDGRVMCPSYRATREEEHATRGRVPAALRDARRARRRHRQRRLALQGGAATRSTSACPARAAGATAPMHVDMATYKAEFLAHHYAGRLRPLAHYSMGWLPVWARLAAMAPGPSTALATPPGSTP